MSILKRGWVAAAALCVAMSVAARADPALPDRAQPMRVVLVRDTTEGCAPSCAEWLSAQGRIVPGTHMAFERALQALDPHRVGLARASVRSGSAAADMASGSRRPPVFIDSLGGSVDDALAIGRAIRARHLDVVVTRTDFDACAGAACRLADGAVPATAHGMASVCASACVLILAAGSKRDVAPWTLVGVHQMILDETLTRTERLFRVVTRQENGVRIVVSRTQIAERALSTTHVRAPPPAALTARVARYLSDMGIGPALMPLMEATPPTSIHWMTRAEGRDTLLVTDLVDGTYVAARTARDAREAAASRTAPLAESLPEAAGLVIAGPDPGKPRTFVGRVTWSLAPGPAADAAAPVLQAAIEVPDAGLSATIRMTSAPNPAHVAAPEVDVALVPAAGGAVRTIDRIALFRMRAVQPARDYALAGTPLPSGLDSYAFQLSDDAVHAIANAATIEGRPWIDLPMLVNGGTVAKLTFEHGASSTPLIRRAFDAWSAAPSPPTEAAAPRS